MADFFKTLPPQGGSARETAEVVRHAMQGKLNCTDEVTLTPDLASTVLVHPLLGPNSVILFMPQTSAAKDEGTPYVTDQGKGTATLNHVNSAVADRTYRIAIFG